MKIFRLLILFILPFSGFAQKEASVWYFGNRAGIDFSNGTPVAATNGVLNTEEGCASISDASGKLLFYTDGRQVLNRLHKTMPNGTGLNGSVSSTQSAVIIKSPGSDSIYYIFTVGAERQETGLCYSVVNMKKDGGNGDVVQKNVNLMMDVYEKIGAVTHCNKRDSWVVARKFGTDNYYSFLVTAEGVQTTPRISRSGFVVQGNTVNTIGVLRFSNDGRKMAAVHSYGNDIVELLDFDALSGTFSNTKLLKANPGAVPAGGITGAYGAEFSPDNRLLYVTWYNSIQQRGLVAQFNIMLGSEAAIQSSLNHVADISGLPAAAQLGPDNKIYITCWRENFLSVIHNPNIPGAGCNFEYQSFKLGEPGQHYGLGGLPSFVQSYFSPDALAFDFQRTGACTQKKIDFFINRSSGADSVKWIFGDPSSPDNTSSLLNPSHTYAAAGVYPVTLVVYRNDCTKTNDTILKEIWIQDFADDLLGPDRNICPGEEITVSVPVTDVGFVWNDGSTAPDLQISQEGTYWVEISQVGCMQYDTVNVGFKPQPSVELGKDTSLCAGQQVVLDATTAGVTYQWNTGATTPTIIVTNTGFYSVTVSLNGCTAMDSVRVEPGSCRFFMPNAFTPNGDGLNDRFGLANTGTIRTYHLQIYNRWGKPVFSTKNKDERWDGKVKGLEAETGMYVWTLMYTTENEDLPQHMKGTVQLIR